MKKKLIAAGAASLAVAAMPMVGVFATTHINGSPIVDQFSIEVGDVCTFTRKSGAEHPTTTIPTGMEVTNDGWSTVEGTTDLFSAVVLAGNTYDQFAKSQFNITCNDATGGYKVTATPTGLTNADVTDGIAYNPGTTYASSGSSWFLTSSAATVSGSTPVVWQHAAYNPTVTGTEKLTSEDFTITYNMKIALDQEVATYTGNVSYALADLSN